MPSAWESVRFRRWSHRAREFECDATTGRCARKEELDEADRQSLLGNVGLFGGAAVAALGTYFVVTAPSVEPLRGLRVDVGPRYLGVGGSF